MQLLFNLLEDSSYWRKRRDFVERVGRYVHVGNTQEI